MPAKKAAHKTARKAAALTTAQRLGTVVKSARDIMRKDKGLNGDLDRLPMLTWVMFLKFLDDLEQAREIEAELAGEKFKPAIEKPYRWRDWAANPQGITGLELLTFINGEECTRPDGKKGPGLFAYLRSLGGNGDGRREVVATVFSGVDSRMRSGYLLRDVIDKVGSIHFTSSDELHTLGALYEGMLREMRDAAGDSGEFYTPRAVVVPNGTLFGDGVCARIKEDLLKDFNLHTIVRLPNGTFAPYTSIPTNIVFFERSGPTKDVWYYEQPLPEGRKNYTKTQPIQFEEFADCLKWWGKRKESAHAWKVSAKELLANGCNLDRKNPNAKDDITHLPPDVLAASILEKERRIAEIVVGIQKLLKS